MSMVLPQVQLLRSAFLRYSIWIDKILTPSSWIAPIAGSRPDPDPLTTTSTQLSLCLSWAYKVACSGAFCAANGVPFLDPLSSIVASNCKARLFLSLAISQVFGGDDDDGLFIVNAEKSLICPLTNAQFRKPVKSRVRDVCMLRRATCTTYLSFLGLRIPVGDCLLLASIECLGLIDLGTS